MRTIIKQGSIDLPAKGFSMFPFIKEGNICRFIPVTTLNKGDIVLYLSTEMKLITHRFSHKDKLGRFIIKGDANLAWDEPVEIEQLIGKLTHIDNGKKVRKAQSIVSNLWGKIILRFPILSDFIRFKLRKNGILGEMQL